MLCVPVSAMRNPRGRDLTVTIATDTSAAIVDWSCNGPHGHRLPQVLKQQA